ncbi:MAG: hypothetical protein U5K69_20790 [Balneolaceae bacterium]|nr:hypothetical protein [Balneolaceae bacterium]
MADGRQYIIKRILTSLKVLLVLLFLLPSTGLPLQLFDGPVQLSQSDFSLEDQTIYIADTWRFQPGDNMQWASPTVDDSDWQKVSTYLGPSELPFIDWEGIGWFRLHISVDSTLVNYPLALLIEQHNGASQIYLDGKLLYSLGEVSMFEEDFQPYRDLQRTAHPVFRYR